MAKKTKTAKELELEIAKKAYEIEVAKIEMKYLRDDPKKIGFKTE